MYIGLGKMRKDLKTEKMAFNTMAFIHSCQLESLEGTFSSLNKTLRGK